MLYTILAGAKRHRIEPWAYVKDLLVRLHAEDLRLEDMLPDRWAAALFLLALMVLVRRRVPALWVVIGGLAAGGIHLLVIG